MASLWYFGKYIDAPAFANDAFMMFINLTTAHRLRAAAFEFVCKCIHQVFLYC